MKTYCLGFIVSPEQSEVALLQKRSSDCFNPSAWNGVGGKVEEGETPLQAIARETHEETALCIPPHHWRNLGVLSDGQTFSVHIFAATSDLENLRTTTDETVARFTRQEAKNVLLAHGVQDILRGWLEGEMLVSDEH